MEDLPNLYFMFFERYEIHIQAFANGFYGRMSYVNPHLHKIDIRNDIILIIHRQNKSIHKQTIDSLKKWES